MADLTAALGGVEDASSLLFDADPAIRSVGVGRNGDGFAYLAIRNVAAPVAYAARLNRARPPETINGVAVHYLNSTSDPASLAKVPHTGPGSPGTFFLPEQQLHRPLVCGLQLQNYDHDLRAGIIANGAMTVGTLGCFVKLPSGLIAILSNNHVLAAENSGVKGADRIQQPGGASLNVAEIAATLTDFVPLVPSPPGASVIAGTVKFNDVDVAVATLDAGVLHQQTYLPQRPSLPPRGTAIARVGDRVHKVGRTTGLTWGEVTQVSVQVGPVAYGIGGCWFRQSIVVEGINGGTFSMPGDSGSAIVRDADGMVLALLYAGNGTQTYACPIAAVLNSLALQLA